MGSSLDARRRLATLSSWRRTNSMMGYLRFGMRSLLFKFYWKLEKLFFPALKYSQYHYYETLKRAVPAQCAWLDLGCGHQMFASWMTAEEQEVAGRAVMLTGIDLDWEGLRANPFVSARVLGTLESLPFRAEAFDLATANMVVEHLRRPPAVLQEVYRVLRPGGLLILHTPNRNAVMIRIAAGMPQSMKNLLARLLEGRKAEDVFPAFYRMNTPAAIEQIAAASGFRVQQVYSISSSAVTALLGPVAIVELLYLRLLEANRFRNYRSNLIAVLQKAA